MLSEASSNMCIWERVLKVVIGRFRSQFGDSGLSDDDGESLQYFRYGTGHNMKRRFFTAKENMGE